MSTTTAPLLSLTATVRAHFGLSLRQLGRYLGISSSFVANIEAGRKGLPATAVPRLLVLSRLLPPGPVAVPAAATYDPLLPLPPPDAALWPELTDTAPLLPEPLRSRQRDCRLRLLETSRRLMQAQTLAAVRAHRRRGLAALQAAPPPPDPAEAPRYARWLTELAEDLAYDEPNPVQTATARRLLAARVAALRAELAALQTAAD